MSSDSYIFDIVMQKVKIFFSKFSKVTFLAKHQRKQVFVSSFLTTILITTEINNRYLALAYSLIAYAFRWRAESTIWRATSAKRRGELTIRRATSAKRRVVLTKWRAISAIGRVELTIWRAISAIMQAELAMQQGTSTIHFKGAETWLLTHSF